MNPGAELGNRQLDYGILIGLFSARHGVDIELHQQLVSEEKIKGSDSDSPFHYKGIMAEYRRKLAETIALSPRPYAEDLDDRFYRPSFYSLWGSFDVGMVAMIDDFEVVTRLGKATYASAMQFLVHAIPDVSDAPEDLRRCLVTDPLVFYSGEDAEADTFPFVGVAQIKVNALLRIGFGNRLLYETIRRIIASTNMIARPENLKVLVLKAVGWNELTLVVHARDLCPIASFLEIVRNMTFGDLDRDYFDNPAGLELCGAFYEGDQLQHGHVVATTRTICGQPWPQYLAYREGAAPPVLSSDVCENCGEKVSVGYGLTCKPGHAIDIVTKLGLENEMTLYDVRFGKSDLTPTDLQGQYPAAAFAAKYAKTTADLGSQHTFYSVTDIQVPVCKNCLKADGVEIIMRQTRHDDIYPKLSALRLEELEKQVRHNIVDNLRLPKAVVTEFLHVTSMLHMCLQDPLVFDLFLDFIPFFKGTLKQLANTPSRTEAYRLCRGLEIFIERVNQAMSSRYANTYSTVEVTDLAVEVKGAYQSLLSAVSGFCHALLEFAGIKNAWALPMLLGVKGPECMDDLDLPVIRMNRFDLTQPEGLLQFVHEIAHAYLREGNESTLRFDMSKVRQVLDEMDEQFGESGHALPPHTHRRYREFNRSSESNHSGPAEVVCDLTTYFVGCGGNEVNYARYFWLNLSRSGMYGLERTATLKMFCIRFFSVLSLVRGDPLSDPAEFVRSVTAELRLCDLVPLFEEDGTLRTVGRDPERDSPAPDIERISTGLKATVGVLRLAGIEEFVARLAEKTKDLVTDADDREIDYDAGLVIREAPADFASPDANMRFCHVVLRDFVDLLWPPDQQGKRWFKRNGKNVPVFSRDDPDFMVDLRGGTFVRQPSARKKYYQSRMALFFSLMDFSHRKKYELILDSMRGGET